MKTLIFALIAVIALVLLTPLAVREAFFRLPPYSETFDCDDAALMMMERLDDIGITGAPILGNLKMYGEEYLETDHIWLLADIAGKRVALDRGAVCVDRQHYEGFLLSKQELLEFIEQDYKMARPGVPAGP